MGDDFKDLRFEAIKNVGGRESEWKSRAFVINNTERTLWKAVVFVDLKDKKCDGCKSKSASRDSDYASVPSSREKWSSWIYGKSHLWSRRYFRWLIGYPATRFTKAADVLGHFEAKIIFSRKRLEESEEEGTWPRKEITDTPTCFIMVSTYLLRQVTDTQPRSFLAFKDVLLKQLCPRFYIVANPVQKVVFLLDVR